MRRQGFDLGVDLPTLRTPSLDEEYCPVAPSIVCSRLKALRAVFGFSLAAILFSALVWFSDPALRILALAPFTSDEQSSLPISLFTYAFVHARPFFLFWSITLLVIAGFILEPRVGSRTTLFIILGGILLPGIFWMAFGKGGALITGSSGVFYAMVGGFLALWHRHWSRLNLPERILIGIMVAWAALGVISAMFSPWDTWTPAMGIPVGYGIALGFDPSFKAADSGPAKEGIR